jgi:hypothetical protein
MDDQPKIVTEVKQNNSSLSVAGRRDMAKAMQRESKNPYVFN